MTFTRTWLVTLTVLAALMATAGAATAVEPAPVGSTPRYLTAMTFNIAHAAFTGDDLAPIAAVIRSAHPDVVGLQEVDRSWSRSGSVDQAAVLAKMLGMRSYYDPNLDCRARDTDGDGACQYGTAILSRHPFVAGSGRQYGLPGRVGEEPRGLARITIDVSGRLVDLFNTHLSFVAPTRMRQVAFIKGVVARDRRPWLLSGDLNALPFHLEMVSLRRVARDAAIAAGRPYLRTTALAHPVRLDYIMLPRPPIDGPPRRVDSLYARVIYAPRVSDHRPLVARVRVPGAP